MDCETYKKWISRQIDDELEPSETQRIEHHIAACSSCATFREDLLKLRSIIAGSTIPSPSPGFKSRVMAGAREELCVRRSGPVRILMRRMAVAALLLAALTVGLFALGTEPIQAVDTSKEIHYEDLFQQMEPGEEDLLLEVLSRTTNPRTALRLFFEKRQPER